MRVLELSPSGDNGSSTKEDEPLPQDADYSNVLSISDELETSILARFPRSQLWKLCFLNKRFLALARSGEIYKIRKEIGLKEPSVFMLASGESNWWGMEWPFMSSKKLPPIQSDYNFECGDKESFCAGSHLFVFGKEIDGPSLGDELLVIGAPSVSQAERALCMYTGSPDPADHKFRWRQIGCSTIQLNHFIRNCAVMWT
ncbi:hypothetical protein DEO72_LG6g1354 [Vigna unguiculata]|uniref:F-box domain-containing protein n=1 Tax=Vigna unguiculata TaxID=3917 RepID=A0A4D6M6X9_VIGUN|nr:hypothetical protein DEO72_LG6g1354 [Vigna unguiculata]